MMPKNIVRSWYLNDTVINDYLGLIVKRDPTIYAFDSYFFNRLNLSNYEGVRRWTKNVDIFSKSKLFIPINIKTDSYSHWGLVYIEVAQKTIYYYDSLFQQDTFDCAFNMLQYLAEEYWDKLHKLLDVENWTIKMAVNPNQNNGVDCGVFILTFAEYISRSRGFNFSQANMLSFRQLILYELTTKELVNVDVEESEIDEFIRSIVTN